MITLLVICAILIGVGFLMAFITGLITISPLLLLIICLPVIDFLVIKKIFFKKKK